MNLARVHAVTVRHLIQTQPTLLQGVSVRSAKSRAWWWLGEPQAKCHAHACWSLIAFWNAGIFVPSALAENVIGYDVQVNHILEMLSRCGSFTKV
jgi:hypothetical protein